MPVDTPRFRCSGIYDITDLVKAVFELRYNRGLLSITRCCSMEDTIQNENNEYGSGSRKQDRNNIGADESALEIYTLHTGV